MTNKNLTVLWTVIGSACFYYAANTWSMSQGGRVLFPGALIDERDIPGSYLGSFIVAILLTALVAVGRSYLRGKERRHWSQRFPVVGLGDLSPKDSLSRWYQGVFLFAFIIVPMASLIHFSNKVVSHADVGDRETRTVYDNQVFYIDELSSVFSLGNYRNRYCMGRDLRPERLCSTDPDNDYQGGVTWFPVISPALMILVSAAAFLFSAQYVYLVVRRRSPKKP